MINSRGVKFPLQIDEETGQTVMIEGKDVVNQSIGLTCAIKKGEFRYLEHLGSGLWSLLGQLPEDAALGLARTMLKSDIPTQNPGVFVRDIKIWYNGERVEAVYVDWEHAGSGEEGRSIWPYSANR